MGMSRTEQIRHWIEQHREQLLEQNRAFVAIPSVNRYPYGDEAEVQKLMQHTLQQLGCEVDSFLPTEVEGLLEHPAYLGERYYDNRPNVVGVKRGSGAGRSLMFSGHVDTVPVGNAPWSIDPFSGAIANGKQYGLGIFDMKAGLLAAVSALQALEALNIRLQGDVYIESVVDEEYGGANGTLACRLKGYTADLAIIAEPTNGVVCPVHQGGAMYRITFEGNSGRGFSGEELISPVFAAGRFLDIFRQYQQYHASKPAPPMFADVPPLPAYIQGMKAGEAHLPLLDRSPADCSIDIWLQCYPGTTEDEMFEDFKHFYEQRAEQDELLQRSPGKLEKLIRFLPGSGLPEGHEGISVIQHAAMQAIGRELTVQGGPFACDGFMFNLHSNTPALVWGTTGGNAHAPDEFIDIDAYLQLVHLYAQTMIEWCGAAE